METPEFVLFLVGALKEHGPTVVIVLLIVYAGKIARFIERVLGKLSPAWAEKRRREQERENHKRAQREKDQLDTILVLKDMLLQWRTELDDTKLRYRAELDDARLERKQLHNVIVELVGKYERLAAQVVEVLRDISGMMRMLMERVEVLTRKQDGE